MFILELKVLNDAVVLFTLELNVLWELLNVLNTEPLAFTLSVKLFNEAVAVLIELLYELNDDVVTNEDVLTFSIDEVVANPKFVIWADELTVPAGAPVVATAFILLSN